MLNSKNLLSIRLLRFIGSPFQRENEVLNEENESLELYNFAFHNKISLLYLDKLKKLGRLGKFEQKYNEEYGNYLNLLEVASEVSRMLNNSDLQYIVFKTLRPYVGIGSDIDMLILGDNLEYRKVIEILLKTGYTPKDCIVDRDKLKTEMEYKKLAEILSRPIHSYTENLRLSPSGMEFKDPKYNLPIDLQNNIATNYVIYMDKDKFRGYITEVSLFNQERIKVLVPEFELAVVMAHSMAEQMFLLSEYYIFIYYLKSMESVQINNFVKIVTENRLSVAAKIWVGLISALHDAAYGFLPESLIILSHKLGSDRTEAQFLLRRDFELPIKYKLTTLLRVFLEKITEAKFMGTLFRQALEMLKHPSLVEYIIFQIIDRRTRKTYIKGITISKIDLHKKIYLGGRNSIGK